MGCCRDAWTAQPSRDGRDSQRQRGINRRGFVGRPSFRWVLIFPSVELPRSLTLLGMETPLFVSRMIVSSVPFFAPLFCSQIMSSYPLWPPFGQAGSYPLSPFGELCRTKVAWSAPICDQEGGPPVLTVGYCLFRGGQWMVPLSRRHYRNRLPLRLSSHQALSGCFHGASHSCWPRINLDWRLDEEFNQPAPTAMLFEILYPMSAYPRSRRSYIRASILTFEST